MYQRNTSKRSGAAMLCVLLALLVTACANGTTQAGIKGTPTPTSATISWARGVYPGIDPYVDRYISTMSLDARIGQLIFAQIYNGSYDNEYRAFIRTIQPGGMIFYRPQIATIASAQQLTTGMQHDSAITILTGADNEGGSFDNLDQIFPGKHPQAGMIGDTNDTQYAYNQGAQMAADSKAAGLTIDLAPVVDVPATGAPPCSAGGYCRLFGNTPDKVTKMAGAWLQGLQDHGVVGTLKHFPGLGATPSDPHKGLPVVSQSHDEIEKLDLSPYRALIDSSNVPDVVMSTDILMPAIDPTVPSELSQPTITGVLRDELHYDGVVITDALYMQGIGDFLHADARADATLVRAGVMSIQAGCDMILGTYTFGNTQSMVNGIKAAIQSGTLTEVRINQSVHRILMMKIKRGIWSLPYTPDPLPGGNSGPLPRALPTDAGRTAQR